MDAYEPDHPNYAREQWATSHRPDSPGRPCALCGEMVEHDIPWGQPALCYACDEYLSEK